MIQITPNLNVINIELYVDCILCVENICLGFKPRSSLLGRAFG